MSLRQWFAKKKALQREKDNPILRGTDASLDVRFSFTNEVATARQLFHDHIWLAILAALIGFWLLPMLFLIPQLRDYARATTWVVIEDVLQTSDVGRAMNIASSTTGLPVVTFYDRTNKKAKYAQRESSGLWTVEDIETFGADYGVGAVANIKFGIAIDPADSKPSVTYCKYGSPATSSQLRYAHRVGGGSGNCGTSNNWSCSNIGSTNDSCTMRMISLMFHTTSSKPVAAWAEPAGSNGTVLIAEYNGTSWNTSEAVPSTYGILYDQDQIVLAFTTSTNQPMIIYSDDTGSRVRLFYRTRQTNWTWSSDTQIDNWGYDSQIGPRLKSIDRDSNGYFYFSYTTYNSGLRYGTLKGTTLTTTTIDSNTSSTWNSIALNSSGNPGIAYLDSTNSDLELASYNGSTWSTETVSSTNNVGDYSSLYYYGTSPVIAYQDSSNANASFISATAFNTAPTAPTTPYSSATSSQTGLENPTNLATTTPAFSALFQDADSGNTASKAEIQVTTTTNGFATITHWDSGSSGNSITSVAINARSADLYFNKFGNSASTTISINDDGTEASNVTYYWRMRFWDAAASAGSWSATATFSIIDKPTAPSSVSSTLSATTADVYWLDNSSIEDAVEIQYSSTDSEVSYSHLASSTAANALSTSTSGLSKNALYYFRARAYNVAGYSSASTATSGYTLVSAPTSVVGTSQGVSSIKVLWGEDGNPGTTEYYVLNVTAGTNSGWTTATQYTFTGLSPSTAYSFQVKARNAQNVETSYSSVASATTDASSTGTTTGAGSTQKVAEKQASIVRPTGSVSIFGADASYTSSTAVMLLLRYSNDTMLVKVSNDPGFDRFSEFRPRSELPWEIVGGEGVRTLYVKFVNTMTGVESNVYAASITLDTTPPKGATITLPAQEAQVDETPTFAGYGDPKSGIKLLAQNIKSKEWYEMGETEVGVDGAWNYEQTTPLSGATYTVFAIAYDRAGNQAKTSGEVTIFVEDETAPEKPYVRFPQEDTVVESAKMETFGAAEPGSRVVIVLDDVITYTAGTNSAGLWNFEIPADLAPGRHTLTYRIYDNSGNESEPITIMFVVKGADAQRASPEAIPVEPEENPFEREIIPLPIERRERIRPYPSAPAPLAPRSPSGTGGSGGPAPRGPVGGTPQPSVSVPPPEAPPPPVSPNEPVIGGVFSDAQQGLFGQTVVAVTAVYDQAADAAKRAGRAVAAGARAVRKVADKPAVQITNKAVVVPATAAVAAVTVSSAVNVSQAAIYLRFVFLQPFYLLRRKRRAKSGLAYNAITKMPIDLALVRLIDVKQNKVVQTRVTDTSGRYQFFADAGDYSLEVTKPEFSFPPEYLKGKNEDAAFAGLYTGGAVSWNEPSVVSYALPLDPAGAVRPVADILKEHTKKYVAHIATAAGLGLSIFSFVITPTPLVGAFVVGHLISTAMFRRLAKGRTPKSWGIVYDAADKMPVAKAVMRIFDTQYNKLLETQVTDAAGRYSFLVGPNEYYVMIEGQGIEKFVSQPVKVAEQVGGSLVAFDVGVKLVQEPRERDLIASVVPSAAAPVSATHSYVIKPQYVPKETLVAPAAVEGGVVGALLKTISAPTQTQQQRVLQPEAQPQQQTVVLAQQVAAPQTLTLSPAITDAPSYLLSGSDFSKRLLAPIGSGARDMIIVGMPKDLLSPTSPIVTVADGNLLAPHSSLVNAEPLTAVTDGNLLVGVKK